MALLDQIRIPEPKLESVREGATKIGQDLAAELARAGRQVRVEEWLDDLGKRVKLELPRERIETIVARLQRELPDTDKGRYDRAYERGWAQARTTYLGAGLVLGLVVGVLGALFLDPRHGAERRAAVAGRAKAFAGQAASRARELAPATPAAESATPAPDDAPTTSAVTDAAPGTVATETAPLVPVMAPTAPAASAPADPPA